MQNQDLFFNGKMILRQPLKGYRHAIDPVLLAHFCQPGIGDQVLDLGTGNGIIPVILAFRKKDITISAVEIQTELYQMALENISLNQLTDRVTVVNKDMRELPGIFPTASFDLVVSNPPYIKQAAGRINPDSQKAIARHEIKITLDELLKTAYAMMKSSGRFSVIFSANRMADLICKMRQHDIEPKRIRFVHARKTDDAKLVLVEGRKHGKEGLKTLAPVVIYDREEQYTDEINWMFHP